MRVLAFRHVPFEGVGRIAGVLDARGIALQYADLYRPGAVLPQTAEFDGLIFMGGPMSVNDPLPYLEWEMRAIGDAVKRGQPVLGICLGSQLIAKELGARVYRNSQPEIGWFDLRLTAEGLADPVFAGLPEVHPMFHWHGETFDLPPGAALLASSARTAHQAFRFGDRTYGLQYHPEITPEMISCWCAEDDNCSDVRELDAALDPDLHAETLGTLSEAIFSRWCDMLCSVHWQGSAQ